jgi:hypothetical protein
LPIVLAVTAASEKLVAGFLTNDMKLFVCSCPKLRSDLIGPCVASFSAKYFIFLGPINVRFIRHVIGMGEKT